MASHLRTDRSSTQRYCAASPQSPRSQYSPHYFAWLSDDQISEGHADVNHTLIAAAAAIVNNLGGQAGREQPLMRECFQAFEPIVPREFWPRHEKGGGYHAAIARTLWANYQVYQTIALDAHAIAHLRLIGREAGQTQRQPKWQAAKAWERAKALWSTCSSKPSKTKASKGSSVA